MIHELSTIWAHVSPDTVTKLLLASAALYLFRSIRRADQRSNTK